MKVEQKPLDTLSTPLKGGVSTPVKEEPKFVNPYVYICNVDECGGAFKSKEDLQRWVLLLYYRLFNVFFQT